MIAVQAGKGLHHRRIGAGPAVGGRLGHEEGGARGSRDQRLQKSPFLLLRRDLAQEVHIAFVGRHHVERDRPERRQAGGAQHQEGLRVAQMPAVRQDVRRQQAGGARMFAQFRNEVRRRAVRAAAEIAFISRNHIADEPFGPRGDCGGAAIFRFVLAHAAPIPPSRTAFWTSLSNIDWKEGR
jgi:hypothetical protein